MTKFIASVAIVFPTILCFLVGCKSGTKRSVLEERKHEIEAISQCRIGSEFETCKKALIEKSVVGKTLKFRDDDELDYVFDQITSDAERVYGGSCLIKIAHRGSKVSEFKVDIIEAIGSKP